MPRQRNGKGRYDRQLSTAQRDAEAARLRTRHYTYEQIAEQLGFADRGHAYKAVERALKSITREPAEELRALELQRLDRLARAAEEVLERRHVHVSGGNIVRDDETGESLEDDGPTLQAIDRLLKIQARRAALLGLDSATKTEHSGQIVTYRIDGVDLDQLT
jgi:hypothetical protein